MGHAEEDGLGRGSLGWSNDALHSGTRTEEKMTVHSVFNGLRTFSHLCAFVVCSDNSIVHFPAWFPSFLMLGLFFLASKAVLALWHFGLGDSLLLKPYSVYCRMFSRCNYECLQVLSYVSWEGKSYLVEHYCPRVVVVNLWHVYHSELLMSLKALKGSSSPF